MILDELDWHWTIESTKCQSTSCACKDSILIREELEIQIGNAAVHGKPSLSATSSAQV
jgi:hypothetical protein